MRMTFWKYETKMLQGTKCINFPRIRNCDHFVPVVLIPDFSEMNASTRQKLHQLNSIWATAVLIVSLLKMI